MAPPSRRAAQLLGILGALAPALAWGQGLDLSGSGGTREEPTNLDGVLDGWESFTNVWLMVDISLILLVASLLGAVIAYHPLTRSKASSIEELEQPKTFIMYAMVGAVIGIIVPLHPQMGLVVFGIGGLLRFRTNVGPAKDTGRVILAVIVGVCIGLKMIVAGILATAFGWVIIYILERQDFGRMMVKGLERDAIPRAAEAYRRVLTQSGCRILGEKKKVTKGTVTFVFSAPRALDREGLDQFFERAIPEEIRGAVDWDIS